jgi:Mrp family chromosome partitioning ATPase
VDGASSRGPGVIVVAERPLTDLLSTHDVAWVVQERQPSIAAMWDALSGGRLDQHSRILVFSDSLQEGTESDAAELQQTARAIVAMSHAGARVFVAVWRPAGVASLQQLIEDSAKAQGVPASSLVYHLLPVEQGGRAVLESMRRVLEGEVDFPASYPATVAGALSRQRFTPSPVWSADTPVSLPLEVPVTAPEPVAAPGPISVEGLADVEDVEVSPEVQVLDAGVDVHDVDALDDFDDLAGLEDLGVAAAAGAPGGDAPIELQRPDEPAPQLPPEGLAPAPLPTPVPEATPEPAARPPIGVSGAAHLRPNLPPIRAEGAPEDRPRSGDYDDLPPNASRELLDRPKRPGQVTITVTSSKGGSGKSTASILLAGSIARASRDAGQPLSVCLLDLDTRDGQVASLIGKFMPTALNIRVQPVWDEERIRRNLVHAEGLGVDTLLAPIRPRTADTVGPDFYRTIIRSLQRMYDVIVMDTSVQYLDPLIAQVALPEADEILFVTTLASTAVQGMARALREITAPIDESGLGIPREKIGIIVNQSVANVGMERDQVLAAGLGVPVVGVIPLATKDVLTATNLNRMFTLLDHPLLGPAYNELGRACLPGREMSPWHSTVEADPAPALVSTPPASSEEEGRKRGLFRR